jgi:hypothetical protein
MVACSIVDSGVWLKGIRDPQTGISALTLPPHPKPATNTAARAWWAVGRRGRKIFMSAACIEPRARSTTWHRTRPRCLVGKEPSAACACFLHGHVLISEQIHSQRVVCGRVEFSSQRFVASALAWHLRGPPLWEQRIRFSNALFAHHPSRGCCDCRRPSPRAKYPTKTQARGLARVAGYPGTR